MLHVPWLPLQVGGADAPSRASFNYQLAYGSQSPVTELPPTKKGACPAPSAC